MKIFSIAIIDREIEDMTQAEDVEIVTATSLAELVQRVTDYFQCEKFGELENADEQELNHLLQQLKDNYDDGYFFSNVTVVEV